MIPTGTPVPNHPRDARREAFVAAAQALFFADGYAGTAMSTIAAKVGGSKTTLWSHFPSKEALFAAVVDAIVERYGHALEVEMPPAGDVEEVLRRFGTAMMETVLSPPIVDLHRLVIGEAGRFPELGRLFYERGAKRGKAKLAAFIDHAMQQGRLRDGDAAVAARQFAFLCQSGHHQHRLLGVADVAEDGEIAADVETAIDTFMRAWGPPPTQT